MSFLFVALGGGLGSLARFGIVHTIKIQNKKWLAPATILVNLTGAYALGVVMHLSLPFSLLWLFVDGFLGGYTTFSTFAVEGVILLKDSRKNALLYIGLSLILGIVGYLAGKWTVGMLR